MIKVFVLATEATFGGSQYFNCRQIARLAPAAGGNTEVWFNDADGGCFVEVRENMDNLARRINYVLGVKGQPT